MRCLLIIIALFFSIHFHGQELLESSFLSDRVILKLKSEFLRADITEHQIESSLAQIVQYKELKIITNLSGNEVFRILELDNEERILNILNAINELSFVDYAEPDYVGSTGGQMVSFEPNDPEFRKQWSLLNQGDFDLSFSRTGADINIREAWDLTTGDSSVIVAFLDSGLKLDHPEFKNRIWINKKEIQGNFGDDDKNGYTDDYRGGWDFVNEDPFPSDDHGHGTNVTSIYGANGDNGLGFAGIDWQGKIMVLKVINANNLGVYSDWARAIYYAVDNGAKVISMSIGGPTYSQSLKDAVLYAFDHDVTLIACSMNTNSDWKFYPAGYQEVIAVGSTDPDDSRSSPFFWDRFSGSNYGEHLDIVAPGNYIFGLHYKNDNSYGSYWGGTSQAVPHVTGVAALLLSLDSTLTPNEIREILRASSDDLKGSPSEDKEGFDVYHGYGRLNAGNALNSLFQTTRRNGIQESQFLIYPNPVSQVSSITISRTGYIYSGLKYQWIDLWGRALSEIQGVESNRIPLPGNPSNQQYYFLKLLLDKETHTFKINVF